MKLEQESSIEYCRADHVRPDVSVILEENQKVVLSTVEQTMLDQTFPSYLRKTTPF